MGTREDRVRKILPLVYRKRRLNGRGGPLDVLGKTGITFHSRCGTIKMKWLRYQRVISLETQVGVTSQINELVNTNPRTCQRWDQVPRRSKHPLLIGRTRREPISNAKISSQNLFV